MLLLILDTFEFDKSIHEILMCKHLKYLILAKTVLILKGASMRANSMVWRPRYSSVPQFLHWFQSHLTLLLTETAKTLMLPFCHVCCSLFTAFLNYLFGEINLYEQPNSIKEKYCRFFHFKNFVLMFMYVKCKEYTNSFITHFS